MIAAETTTDCETDERRILVADDQKDVLDALQLLLKAHGYVLETVSTPADLLAALAERQFDLLLMDLNYARDTTSGREGLDVLGQLKEMPDAPPVVAMTGWATVGLAVAAMQYGVSDFVEKPWSNSRLVEILEKQIALGRERRESRRRANQERQAREEATVLDARGSLRPPEFSGVEEHAHRPLRHALLCATGWSRPASALRQRRPQCTVCRAPGRHARAIAGRRRRTRRFRRAKL